MKKKVVYQDGDYTKVVRGVLRQDEDFVIISDDFGGETCIGKRFVISITGEAE